ncbi:MAG: hypothetical protein M0C28_47185 [Candidatus Moduliflexus flocculans]|nr:hypothetical protein [Candidatus Moduliflexus flocculans]
MAHRRSSSPAAGHDARGPRGPGRLLQDEAARRMPEPSSGWNPLPSAWMCVREHHAGPGPRGALRAAPIRPTTPRDWKDASGVPSEYQLWPRSSPSASRGRRPMPKSPRTWTNVSHIDARGNRG